MPGFEVFGEEERNEVNEVLNTGILMRYGFDQARAGNWKAWNPKGKILKVRLFLFWITTLKKMINCRADYRYPKTI